MPLDLSVETSVTSRTMCQPEPSNPTTVGPDKCNIAEVQGKDSKIAIMNTYEDLKDDIK